MKKLFAILSVVLFANQASAWEVFGFTSETRLADLNVLNSNLNTENGVKVYNVSPIKPHKFFERYTISYSDKYGICYIWAAGKNPSEDFDEITKVILFNLEKKYGKPIATTGNYKTWRSSASTKMREHGVNWLNVSWYEGETAEFLGSTHNLHYEFDDGECSKESARENEKRIAKQEAEANAKLEEQDKALSKEYDVSEDDF